MVLLRDKKQYTQSIHRLILETFVGPCPKGMLCCHKNDIRTDNRVENLRWGTPADNTKDAFRNGGRKRGEGRSWAKLNDWQVRIIKRLLQYPEDFTQKEIGNLFSVARSTINNIKRKTAWF